MPDKIDEPINPRVSRPVALMQKTRHQIAIDNPIVLAINAVTSSHR